jgi:hypothetical protein
LALGCKEGREQAPPGSQHASPGASPLGRQPLCLARRAPRACSLAGAHRRGSLATLALGGALWPAFPLICGLVHGPHCRLPGFMQTVNLPSFNLFSSLSCIGPFLASIRRVCPSVLTPLTASILRSAIGTVSYGPHAGCSASCGGPCARVVGLGPGQHPLNAGPQRTAEAAEESGQGRGGATPGHPMGPPHGVGLPQTLPRHDAPVQGPNGGGGQIHRAGCPLEGDKASQGRHFPLSV